MAGSAYKARYRWQNPESGILYSQDMVMVRPKYLKGFLQEHPKQAGWNRFYWKAFNVWVLLEGPVDQGILGIRREYLAEYRAHDAAWSALLDEQVEVTSPEGRG